MVLEQLAGNRARLFRSALLGLLPLGAVAFGGAWWIREKSTSPGLDMVIITVWMLLSLGVAYLVALLAGDLLFPKGWRDVQVLGRRSEALDKELDAEDIVRASRGQALPFAGLWATAVLLLGLATHLGTGGFFTWYSQYGYASSVLRGDNQAMKLSVLEEMTRAPDERLVGYAEMVLSQWDSTDEAVRVQAVWSLGEIARRMTRSMELMASGEKGGDWVKGLHEWLQTKVSPLAVAAFPAAKSAEERTALAYALGGLRPPELGPLYEAYLTGGDRSMETDEVVLFALADWNDASVGIPLIREVIRTATEPSLLSLALWSAGEIYGLGTGEVGEAPPDEELVKIIKSRLASYPFEVQCVALDTLTRLRTEETNKALFAIFETVSPPDRRCERVEMARRFGMPELISREEEVREKVVKVLASVAEGNDEVIAWLQRRTADPELASGLRSDMRYILDVLAQRKSQR